MSAEQNIGVARQMYQAFGRGDVQAILDRVTDDVDCPNRRGQQVMTGQVLAALGR